MSKKIIISFSFLIPTFSLFAQDNTEKLNQTDLAILITLVIALVALALTVVNIYYIQRYKKIAKVDLNNSMDDVNLSMDRVKFNLTREIKNIKKELNKNNPNRRKPQHQKEKPVTQNAPAKDTAEVDRSQAQKQVRKPANQNRSKKVIKRPILQNKENPQQEKGSES